MTHMVIVSHRPFHVQRIEAECRDSMGFILPHGIFAYRGEGGKDGCEDGDGDGGGGTYVVVTERFGLYPEYR